MTDTLPRLTQFRVELQPNGLAHLVFDCPDRSMNVFSNKAIHELGEFAQWLQHSAVRGVLIRSGKPTGFCAGADLTELGVAYDMIIAAPVPDRFDIAFDHFFPLSHAIRRLETAGKPVAAAIAGVAMGGGCELALGCHYRVITTNPRALLGLPECAVGLLPGGGGTQRMPRLVGVDLGLDVLLMGRTLQGHEALEAGLVDAVVAEGEEIAAAEAWLLSADAYGVQPWDQPGAYPLDHTSYAAAIEAHRARELTRMLGHEPAPLAILDCVEIGLMQHIDGAIRSEMSIFARLIQRPEPRNMIRTMFAGKQAWGKAHRNGGITCQVTDALVNAKTLVDSYARTYPQLREAGFLARVAHPSPAQANIGQDYWFKSKPALVSKITELTGQLNENIAGFTAEEMLLIDYKLCADGTIPAYLGGIAGLLTACAGASKASQNGE